MTKQQFDIEEPASRMNKEARDMIFWPLFAVSLAGTSVLAAVTVIGGPQDSIFDFTVGVGALLAALIGILGVFVKRARYRMCSAPIIYAAVYLAIYWTGKTLGL